MKTAVVKSLKPAESPRKPPEHLTDDSKTLWLYISRNFALEPQDVAVLDALCETVDRKSQAERDLREHGSLTTVNSRGELKPHPAVTIARDCGVLIARLRRELNLSEDQPESRPPALTYRGGRKR
jgi:P27 family predicted phage terminase small subunit